MGFFKKLFSGQEVSPEIEKKQQETKNFDVLKYDGVAALRQGEFEYAVKCFNHALEIKTDLEINDYLSRAYTAMGQLSEAMGQLQILKEAQPDNILILKNMANIAFMMEDYDEMAVVCDKAETIDADDPQVKFLHARAVLGQGNQIIGVALLTKCITQCEAKNAEDLKDDHVIEGAYLLRGETLLKMGDLNGAGEDADWLMNHSRAENEDVLMLKARVLHAKGENDEAIKFYDRVVDADPFSAIAYKERGAIKLEKGDKEGAEEDARKVLELTPEVANVDGDFKAEGTEDIQRKVEEAYRKNNPFR